MRIPLVIALGLFAAAPASAQVAPFHGPVTIGERHRFEMERLRVRSDDRAAFARDQALNTRLTVRDLQSARPPEPVQPPPFRALRTPEQERALRQAATTRRRSTVEVVTQIDGWLDRPHP